jgi:putative FmdB family regulatory protein
MPIYEYRCEKCGEFEYSQRITDPALQRCPTCKRKVRRLISSTSFQLKGSGWYVTDYARAGGSGKDKDKEKKSGTKDGGAEAGSSSSTSESSSAKSEGSKSEGSKSGDTTKPESKKTANA